MRTRPLGIQVSYGNRFVILIYTTVASIIWNSASIGKKIKELHLENVYFTTAYAFLAIIACV